MLGTINAACKRGARLGSETTQVCLSHPQIGVARRRRALYGATDVRSMRASRFDRYNGRVGDEKELRRYERRGVLLLRRDDIGDACAAGDAGVMSIKRTVTNLRSK
jgi:hypothetical protein